MEFTVFKQEKVHEKGIFYPDCHNACFRSYEEKSSMALPLPPSLKKQKRTREKRVNFWSNRAFNSQANLSLSFPCNEPLCRTFCLYSVPT